MHFEHCVQVEIFGVLRSFLTFGIISLTLCHSQHVGFYVRLGFQKLYNFYAIILTIYKTLTPTSIIIEHIKFIMFELGIFRNMAFIEEVVLGLLRIKLSLFKKITMPI